MSTAILQVRDLSKVYRKASQQRAFGYRTLQEELLRLLGWFTGGRQARQSEQFWALRDVSFEVQAGEAVGIIGRNGAGKSTLLKILSRITEPSSGAIDIYGRVGSLLEVGTGFHPELTGRENIYLNGAILGMRREEISRRFDEIVDFAEVEQFIDTPVKHYSSGMYMRLAFAVAAHLEPEVLVVDEVLAVGDAAFQKKSLGKMGEVARSGRTVLFVSHNMGAIRSLCQRGLLLHGGQLVLQDTAAACADAYLRQYQQGSGAGVVELQRPAGSLAWMTQVRVLCDGEPQQTLPMGGKLSLEIQFEAEQPVRDLQIGLVINTAQGEALLNANNFYQPWFPPEQPVRAGVVRCHLGRVPLMEGRYSVTFWFGEQGNQRMFEHALWFDVLAQDIWGTGKLPPANLTPLWWPTRFRLQPPTEEV
jgi:lipopolysaccharide transport system ATP-binding protein